MKAADIMVSSVVTVSANAQVQEVAKILLANRISAVPVVDDQDKLVGDRALSRSRTEFLHLPDHVFARRLDEPT